MVDIPYVETDCVIEHDGRVFKSGGAIINGEWLIGYVGPVIGGRGFEGRLGSEPPYRALTNWHGEHIGTIRLGDGWRTPRSFISSRMYQAYATVNGITYTGRTGGEGMIFRGRRVKGR